MTLGPFLFAAPWALAALVALPALWWILRATPPAPTRAPFPPTRLLLDVKTDEQSRERAPLWLVLFRALAAALMIIAFAKPSLAPSAAAQAAGGRTLIVIDDGWTSAPFWAEARGAAEAAIAEAERANAPVFLLQTAPQLRPRDAGEAMTAAGARLRLARLNPSPWRPNRADAAKRLNASNDHFARIVWISDGLDDNGAAALFDALKARGPLTVRLPHDTAHAIVAAGVSPQGVEITARRANNGESVGAVAAESIEGRALGAAQLNFNGGLSAHARITLPAEIAARAARVRLVGEQSAGAVRLLPAAAARPFVGLIDPGSSSQPLLSELFYAERALSPYASLQRGTVSDLIAARAQALILPDASALTPGDRTALAHWLDQGGLLVRFAGPRLANDADELLPVRLRPGSRSLGGALAWEPPLAVAPFADDSPFSGVNIAHDVVVRRQVLAEPASLLSARVWARLADNSPLVTAAAHGHGLIVLYHVSAAPDWSDLPLSGMFVEMLRRTLAFAGRASGAGERVTSGGPYAPQRLLDGFGVLAPASTDASPIPAERFALAQPSPATPPGLYERSGVTGAIDGARTDESLTPLNPPAGVARTGFHTLIEQPLAGYFFGLAALMLALDLLVSLFLAGRLPHIARATASAAAALLLLLIAAPHALAQGYYGYGPYTPPHRNAAEQRDPTLTLRLAYVRTGDARVDRISAAGLAALSQTLRERTSVEPSDPIGVDLARDDLSPYPFLYWAAPSAPQRLSDAALANLERYLSVGGLLLVDTRDAGANDPTRRPAQTMLSGLDAPPLEPVTGDDIVGRSFFLLRSFPGRALAPKLWAESGSAAASRDGVAALYVGDGDWAAAWSGETGIDARQREMSLRFGVNMVMVALTGNYKADQVHLPALLERLGRSR